MEQTLKNLQQLPVNTVFEADLFVHSVQFLQSKRGSDYAAIIVTDKTGSTTIMDWNADPLNYPLKERDVIHLTATVEDYQGAHQLRLMSYDILEGITDYTPYLQSAPMSTDEMSQKLNEYFHRIQSLNPKYSQIIAKILQQDKTQNHYNEFLTQPAAMRMHHNFYGGLAYHTLRMLALGEHMLEVYPNLKADLLLTAILLHDFGKLAELSGYLSTQYTVHGELLGHIAILDGWLYRTSQELGYEPEFDEDILLLRHCLLAHHGEKEYGSPVTPKIPEALVLHFIDNFDAKMTMFETEFNQSQPGQLTNKVYGLGNRTLYHPHYNHGVIQPKKP